MKTGGSGGANTNASGKPFEECFRPTGTRVIGGKVFEYIDQDTFVEHMKELKDPQWEHKKKPDGAFVSEDKKTVFIIECKHQIVSGSVDEKLGRFIFKKMSISGQYIQLIMELMKNLFSSG